MLKLRHALFVAGAAIAGLFVHHYTDFRAPGQQPVAIASPSPAPSVAPSDQGVVFSPITGGTEALQAEVLNSEAILQATITSKCFGDFMLGRALIHDTSANSTNGLSNQEVLDRIRTVGGQIPVTIYHQPWYRPSSVMGYRNVGETLIHLRDTSLDSLCDSASLIAHEAIGHVLGGWDHDFNRTAAREYSVPYSINAGFDACCQSQQMRAVFYRRWPQHQVSRR